MATMSYIKRACLTCLVSWPMANDHNECPSCGAGELGFKLAMVFRHSVAWS